MKLIPTNLPGPPLSPPDDPVRCECADAGCDNPGPHSDHRRTFGTVKGTVECPECGGTMCIRSLYDCENCEDGRVLCGCECHGGGK